MNQQRNIPTYGRPQPSTAMTPHQGSISLLFRPDTHAGAMDLVVKLSQETTWLPQCFHHKPYFVGIALNLGEKLGLDPLMSLTNIAVINGKACMWGDLMLGLCRKVYGDRIFYEESYLIDRVGCQVTIKLEDNNGKVVRSHTETFDKADAEKAGLWTKKGTWQSYPNRMCMWRARGFALRTMFPEVLMGLITREEAMDYPSQQQRGKSVGPVVIDAQTHEDDAVRHMAEESVARGAGRASGPSNASVASMIAAMQKAQTAAELKKLGTEFSKTFTAVDAQHDPAVETGRTAYRKRMEQLREANRPAAKADKPAPAAGKPDDDPTMSTARRSIKDIQSKLDEPPDYDAPPPIIDE